MWLHSEARGPTGEDGARKGVGAPIYQQDRAPRGSGSLFFQTGFSLQKCVLALHVMKTKLCQGIIKRFVTKRSKSFLFNGWSSGETEAARGSPLSCILSTKPLPTRGGACPAPFLPPSCVAEEGQPQMFLLPECSSSTCDVLGIQITECSETKPRHVCEV